MLADHQVYQFSRLFVKIIRSALPAGERAIVSRFCIPFKLK